MRFTQILKVYNRLKYIGVIYGERLDNFLSAIGEIFNDSEQNVDKINHILHQEGGYGGKVSRYRVFAEPFSTLGWKVYGYIVTFLLKTIAEFMAKSIQSGNKMNKSVQTKLKFIGIFRHIHFMLFNMVLIDGAFFSTRVIAHIKMVEHSGMFVIAICYLLMLLIVLDLLDIFNTGLQLGLKGNPFHRDEIVKMEKEFVKKIYDEPDAERRKLTGQNVNKIMDRKVKNKDLNDSQLVSLAKEANVDVETKYEIVIDKHATLYGATTNFTIVKYAQ
jgi:hypothetical protein